jgi:hypothetical protein
VLNPSIEKFEDEMCRLLSEDHAKRENLHEKGANIQIHKRHLQVWVIEFFTHPSIPFVPIGWGSQWLDLCE